MCLITSLYIRKHNQNHYKQTRKHYQDVKVSILSLSLLISSYVIYHFQLLTIQYLISFPINSMTKNSQTINKKSASKCLYHFSHRSLNYYQQVLRYYGKYGSVSEVIKWFDSTLVLWQLAFKGEFSKCLKTYRCSEYEYNYIICLL